MSKKSTFILSLMVIIVLLIIFAVSCGKGNLAESATPSEAATEIALAIPTPTVPAAEIMPTVSAKTALITDMPKVNSSANALVDTTSAPAAKEVFLKAPGDRTVGQYDLGMTFKEFKQKFGEQIIEVSDIRREMDVYFNVTTKDATLSFTLFYDNSSDGAVLDYFGTSSSAYVFPRGIKVGDNIDSVIAKFPVQPNMPESFFYIFNGEKFISNPYTGDTIYYMD